MYNDFFETPISATPTRSTTHRACISKETVSRGLSLALSLLECDANELGRTDTPAGRSGSHPGHHGMSNKNVSILVVIAIAILLAWLRSMVSEPSYYADDDVPRAVPEVRAAITSRANVINLQSMMDTFEKLL
jgi:hypothetical protein